MFDSYIVTKEGSIISKFTGKEKSFHSCKSMERVTTIPKGSRPKRVEAVNIYFVGDDIVYSIWGHIAVHKRTGME